MTSERRPDLVAVFLRWIWWRALLHNGWWLVTSVYLVVDAELSPSRLVPIGAAHASRPHHRRDGEAYSAYIAPTGSSDLWIRGIVIAKSTLQVTSASDKPANRATRAMASPHTISPSYSAWAWR